MYILQNRLSKREMLVAVLVVSAALAGCGTSQNQAPAATASVAAAPQATPSSAQAQPPRAKLFTMRAQTPPEQSTKQNTAMVLSQMHQADLREIELGKMAEERASIDKVRAYADQLVHDHTECRSDGSCDGPRRAEQICKIPPRRIERSGTQTAQEKQQERKLKSANGPDFDRLFLRQTNSDHEKLIRELQQDREDASDDDLRP